ARLVGKQTATGLIARRIGAIFRDRDELPVASDLSGKINEALAATQFLVVLCSPASAQSKWVNQEVINFKRLKGEDSIIAVIIGGEPFATNMPGRDAEECFAPALRFRIGPDGALTDQPAEPIAADLRPEKDSKRLVKLKVIAGLLGLGLDELVRRENQRRTQRLFWLSSGMAAAMVVMGVLTVFAIQSRNEAVVARDDAERQKTQAEDLIEFMLGDLRRKLEPVGRLEVLDSVGDKALKYFASLRPNEIDDNTLGRRARALHLIGEIHSLRGNYASAKDVFSEAQAATQELLARAPENTSRLFEHAQSIYWAGYVDWQTGNFSAAERAFADYLKLTNSLTELEPGNPEWQKESGYAYVNVGVLNLDSRQFAAASEKFQRSTAIFRALHDASRESEPIARDHAQSLHWYGASLRAEGFVRQALAISDMERAIYLELIAKDENDRSTREFLVNSNLGRGRLLLDLGDLESALSVLQETAGQAAQLSQHDPENTSWAEREARVLMELAEAQMLAQRLPAARDSQQKSEVIARRLIETSSAVSAWKAELLAPLLILKASILLRFSDTARAQEILNDAESVLDESGNEHLNGRLSLAWLKASIDMARGDALAIAGEKHQADELWKRALTRLGADKKAASFDEQVLRAAVTFRLHPASPGGDRRFFVNGEARRPLNLVALRSHH
ncbi:MAG: toll/interleukin-1 receptor domain-containing protein, partial [Rhodospirillaceae bacterium]|nr:toll/interleukin-1 receptor domain-containing protein [Rhodospirillaceae bacterium]